LYHFVAFIDSIVIFFVLINFITEWLLDYLSIDNLDIHSYTYLAKITTTITIIIVIIITTILFRI